MSFHPIYQDTRTFDRRRQFRRVTVRLSLNNNRPMTRISISNDLLSAIGLHIGDYIRPLIGSGDDDGSFAIERSSRADGYKLSRKSLIKACWIGFRSDKFLNLGLGETRAFLVEIEGNRIICRPPSAINSANVRRAA